MKATARNAPFTDSPLPLAASVAGTVSQSPKRAVPDAFVYRTLRKILGRIQRLAVQEMKRDSLLLFVQQIEGCQRHDVIHMPCRPVVLGRESAVAIGRVRQQVRHELFAGHPKDSVRGNLFAR